MSDDPRVTVPAELVEALREAYNHRTAFAANVIAAARALLDAAKRPAAPVSEPLCRCGHRHPFDPSGTYASQGPPCEGYWTRCGCTKYDPVPPPVPVSDEAEANESFEDELDAHIAESMKDPEYAAADVLHREAEASWRNWVPSMFADDENMHTAYVAGYKDSDAGFRTARQAGKDEQP